MRTELKSKGYVAVSWIEDLESVAYAMNGECEELKKKKKNPRWSKYKYLQEKMYVIGMAGHKG